jgi:hypothetical protein
VKNNKIVFSIMVFSCFLFFSCKDKKNNSSNTFYISYICKNDTLLQILNNATTGKASYYDKEKKLQIVSLNYITEDHPNTHYFIINNELPVKPELNTIKYEIIFNDSMINDSIAYALKKYIYSKNGWQNKSEMGVIKVFDFPATIDKNLRVIKNNVARSVLKTIVIDTYDK